MSKLEIFDNSLIKLIVRKGPNVDRINAVLSEGEPGYTTDTKRLFIGDNTTPGGNVVGNKFLGQSTDLTTLPAVPGVVGDFGYNQSTRTLFHIQSGSGTSLDDWGPISTNISTLEYDGLYTTVQTTSSNWNNAFTTSQEVKTIVQTTSSNWNNAYTTSQTLTTTVSTIRHPVVLPLVTLGEGTVMRDNSVSKFAPFSFVVTKVFASTRETEGGDITYEIYKNGNPFLPSPGVFANIPGLSSYGILGVTAAPPTTITLGDELTIGAATAAADFIDANNIEIWLEGYIPISSINTFLF